MTNIISFNIGVELGQLLALSAILLLLSLWRTRASYTRYALVSNTLLMGGGFILTAYQLTAFFSGKV